MVACFQLRSDKVHSVFQTIVRLILAVVSLVAIFPAIACRLTCLLSFLCHAESASLHLFPPSFPWRLYGGRLAWPYPQR
jgi:hypothetical protein